MENQVQKIIKGQFFTKEISWLKKQIVRFVIDSDCSIAYDPFAGVGDLLNRAELFGIEKIIGLDIDSSLGWKVNDSLLSIPHIEDAIIITNPPYLSNYSASRKKISKAVSIYFASTDYDDLYLVALDKMLEAQKYVVAIVPETFINSNYRQKNKLSSITILEENPFADTDTPVCVLCFDGREKPFNEIKIYKNETFVNDLETLESMRLKADNSVKIKFNDINGWLGLRAVDTTDPTNMLKFDFKSNFNYDWQKGIKVSSRLLSVIEIQIPDSDKEQYIKECNKLLLELRENTQDIILSPFKGNMKNGIRRRRLDYYTARAIMEKVYKKIYGQNNEQLGIF